MIYKYEFEADVPPETKETHRVSFIKMNEANFISKVLLFSLIPWVWMCLLSYLLIGYFDKKAEKDEQKLTTEIMQIVNSHTETLAETGNIYALLYLAEKGDAGQRDKAMIALQGNDRIEVRYFNDVIKERISDIPISDLQKDHQYVSNMISYAQVGYSKAIDDLIELERGILASNKIDVTDKMILEKIQSFKINLNNHNQ